MDAALAAKATEGGDVAWLIVTLLGTVCTLLIVVVGFFIKRAFSERERKDNLLERRLSSGSETMQKMKEEFHSALESIRDSFRESLTTLSAAMNEIKNTIMTVQSNDIQKSIKISEMVSRKDFEEYQARNQREHDDMQKSISDLRDAISEVSESMKSSVFEMRGCVEAVKDLTSKIINKELGSDSTD